MMNDTADLSVTPGITTNTTASTQAISSTPDDTRRLINVLHLVRERTRNASSSPSPELRQLHDVPRLPGDVVALILEYLQIPDLSQTKLVCRDWRDLSDSEQWRHMELMYHGSFDGSMRSQRPSKSMDSDGDCAQSYWKPTFNLVLQFDVDTESLEQILQLLVGVQELRLGYGLSHGDGEHEEDRAKIFLLPGLKGKLLKISNIPLLLLIAP